MLFICFAGASGRRWPSFKLAFWYSFGPFRIRDYVKMLRKKFPPAEPDVLNTCIMEAATNGRAAGEYPRTTAMAKVEYIYMLCNQIVPFRRHQQRSSSTHGNKSLVKQLQLCSFCGFLLPLAENDWRQSGSERTDSLHVHIFINNWASFIDLASHE